ncbi:radical SAM family heme chaperone HemW [Pelomicrobium methylotrophicum]|uniref:Heme chaperone HemW n=1 Tax=Pelomicrobium methylotrophicum TaxID=2602750 RepID=A0A5C7EEK6_9PROT|nr:radical SAM family heme chaperone HemW [Pelomicrobium methylotrophicum]TXF10604.1 oxygen-independent coproporphyrinogen III oxidase-like protein [Pelomicrobium methylotrophicum]
MSAVASVASSVSFLARRPQLKVLPPLALYIHVPWCVRKCPYCDFNSFEARGEIPEKRYIEALTRDLELALPEIWGRRVYSVFFGGGTPSLLSPEAVDAILSAVRARVPLDVHAEVTLEANPGTVEAAKFAGFRAAGVNRLSLGIQSFDDRMLQAIGRVHDGAQARRAVEMALATFENVNLDLMYALPGQELEDCRRDIETAAAYRPAHLSAYHLTIEPNTFFHRYPPRLPDEDTAAAMQEAVEEALAVRGYVHYETSAFAQSGRQCRHNLNYWRFGDYLGIGAGAHSKLTFPGRVVRSQRYKQPKAYLEQVARGVPIQEAHEVPAQALPFEFMMNALRLTAGFEPALFEERTGLPLTAVTQALDLAESKGLIVRDHRRVAPTPLGRRFLNDLLALFLEETTRPAPGRHVARPPSS